MPSHTQRQVPGIASHLPRACVLIRDSALVLARQRCPQHRSSDRCRPLQRGEPVRGALLTSREMLGRQSLARAVARVPAAARSMAGGGSTGGKTPTYKRMRGVVRACPSPALLSVPSSPPPFDMSRVRDRGWLRRECGGNLCLAVLDDNMDTAAGSCCVQRWFWGGNLRCCFRSGLAVACSSCSCEAFCSSSTLLRARGSTGRVVVGNNGVEGRTMAREANTQDALGS